MPRPKAGFDALYPCDFYTPAELLEPDRMYTVYEIARLLQGLDPDAQIDEGTEAILLDWAIPWIMFRSDELVVAEPPEADEPGYYGLRTEGDLAADRDVAPEGASADVEPTGDDEAPNGAGDGNAGDAPADDEAQD